MTVTFTSHLSSATIPLNHAWEHTVGPRPGIKNSISNQMLYDCGSVPRSSSRWA